MVSNSYNGENGEQICFGRTYIQLINTRKYRINAFQARIAIVLPRNGSCTYQTIASEMWYFLCSIE